MHRPRRDNAAFCGRPARRTSDLAVGLAQPSGILITKRQSGPFGTDPDLQLRAHGLKTIVLGGIVRNFGVESTARQFWEYGYDFVITEDAATSLSAKLRADSITEILPWIGIVVRAAVIVVTADRSSIGL
jgi:nicotinamidase-related amidase